MSSGIIACELDIWLSYNMVYKKGLPNLFIKSTFLQNPDLGSVRRLVLSISLTTELRGNATTLAELLLSWLQTQKVLPKPQQSLTTC